MTRSRLVSLSDQKSTSSGANKSAWSSARLTPSMRRLSSRPCKSYWPVARTLTTRKTMNLRVSKKSKLVCKGWEAVLLTTWRSWPMSSSWITTDRRLGKQCQHYLLTKAEKIPLFLETDQLSLRSWWNQLVGILTCLRSQSIPNYRALWTHGQAEMIL